MKILANKKIKALFCKMTICLCTFAVIAGILLNWTGQNAVIYILICAVFMAVAMLAFCYGYFVEQYKTIETAAEQITDYISGNHSARINYRWKLYDEWTS